MGRGSDIGDSGQASERSGIHTARALLLGPGARRGQADGNFERWAAARDSAQATLTMLCHPLVAAVGRAEGMVVARRMLRSRVRRARSRSIICRRGRACASGHMDHQRSSNPTVHRRVARPNGGHGQEGGNTSILLCTCNTLEKASRLNTSTKLEAIAIRRQRRYTITTTTYCPAAMRHTFVYRCR